jgi:tripartite-type tricarboxylate transporter receptor subunit TctC
MIIRPSRRSVVAGLGGLIACPSIARAAYPDKSITIVHGFPGGNGDFLARIVADGLTRHLKATVVVEAKTGAGGTIASAHTARQPADGYTLMIMVGGHAVAAALYKQLAFKPVDDFTMISMLTEFPFVMATYPDHPAKDMKEFVERARKAAEPPLFGTPGNGTGQHMSAELFAAMGKFKLKHVPYRGSGQGVTDVLGKRIDFITDTPTVTVPLIQDKQLRALAVTGEKRFFALPDVPTIAEAGVAGYSTGSWLGLVGPAGLPAEIVATLNKVVHQTLAEPATVERLRKAGSDVVPTTPQAFKARLESDVNKWTEVVSTAGIPRI